LLSSIFEADYINTSKSECLQHQQKIIAGTSREDFSADFARPQSPESWGPFKVLERLLVFELPIRHPIDKCAMVFIPPMAIGKLRN
jgi:hypothetical protein